MEVNDISAAGMLDLEAKSFALYAACLGYAVHACISHLVILHPRLR